MEIPRVFERVPYYSGSQTVAQQALGEPFYESSKRPPAANFATI